jgi:hypothetical protein
MKYLKSFEEYNECRLSISHYKLYDVNWKDYLPFEADIKYINCQFNNFTKLPKLPNTLIQLTCQGNFLKSLPKLPDSLKMLNCASNLDLNNLPNLPSNLEELDCGGCGLTKLPELPDSLKILSCIQNKLEILPKIPKSLKKIYCKDNNWIKPIPYEYFSLNIKEVDVYTRDQFNKFSSFEFQKEFLEKEPENFIDLKSIGYADGIEKLFPHLFDMDELGLLD